MSGPDSTPIPYGCCHCGCGERTPISEKNITALGWRKGEPIRYVKGHNQRGKRKYESNDYYPHYEALDKGYDTLCWIWNRSLSTGGYAQVRKDGRLQGVHRLHYELKHGAIPEGLLPDHLCRQRSCVNPDHIEPVTNEENIRRGANAKLCPEGVREIRRLHATRRHSYKALGQRFGVSRDLVYRIVKRTLWRDV